MSIMQQYRIAVVGAPDSGKSTLVKELVAAVTGRELSPDTLMREVHWSDGRDPMGNPDTRTIKCAKVMFAYGGFEYCMYDCPGHTEYMDQIRQGIDAADIVLHVHNAMAPDGKYDAMVSGLLEGRRLFDVESHAGVCEWSGLRYDTGMPGCRQFLRDLFMPWLANECAPMPPHDVVVEAVELARECIDPSERNAFLFSGGKDSIAGLEILRLADRLSCTEVLYPRSGFDFPEVEEMVAEAMEHYSISIRPFDNSGGLSYGSDSVFDIMKAKADANNRLVVDEGIRLLCVQYRASDEGVRSKDYHIVDKGSHKRFSPVFYFSESNIWRFTAERGLPVCPLYNKGYRSLGDAPVTYPCMPPMESPGDIALWIEAHPETLERAGRAGQDGAVPFAMERLREVGFF